MYWLPTCTLQTQNHVLFTHLHQTQNHLLFTHVHIANPEPCPVYPTATNSELCSVYLPPPNPEQSPVYPPAPNPEPCAVYPPAPNDRPIHKDWTRAASGLDALNVSRMSRYTEPRPKVAPWETKAVKQQLTKTSHWPLHIKGQLKVISLGVSSLLSFYPDHLDLFVYDHILWSRMTAISNRKSSYTV